MLVKSQKLYEVKMDSHFLFKWSQRPTYQTVLIDVPRMMSTFWEYGPISLEHVYFLVSIVT